MFMSFLVALFMSFLVSMFVLVSMLVLVAMLVFVAVSVMMVIMVVVVTCKTLSTLNFNLNYIDYFLNCSKLESYKKAANDSVRFKTDYFDYFP